MRPVKILYNINVSTQDDFPKENSNFINIIIPLYCQIENIKDKMFQLGFDNFV